LWCVQGWPALARLVLPVAVMGQKSVQKTIEEMHTISRGVSLLHLAVRSQNPKMVRPQNMPYNVLIHMCAVLHVA
jgi:hypothetical protein